MADDVGGAIDLPPILEERRRSPLVEPDVHVVLLSLEPDLAGPPPWRHRKSGWLIQLSSDRLRQWPQSVIDWLHDGFEPLPNLEVAESLENLTRIAEVLTSRGHHVVVYNVSTYDPTDRTHRYPGTIDNYAVRAHQAIVGLEQMAGDAGLSVVDVDGAVAEVGAADNVPAPCQLAAAAIDFVTEEAVLAIDQSGAFGKTLQAPVMTVRVPQFDRRTTNGVIAKWHFRSGDEVHDGDVMFEVRFDRSTHRFDLVEAPKDRGRSRRRAKPKRSRTLSPIDVSVVAGGTVVLQEILIPEGAPVSAGSIAAVATSSSVEQAFIDDAVEDFRTGVRVFDS
ncbi:MAG: hypothetical protein ABFR53_09655 [Actinomycetota bacterium]